MWYRVGMTTDDRLRMLDHIEDAATAFGAVVRRTDTLMRALPIEEHHSEMMRLMTDMKEMGYALLRMSNEMKRINDSGVG
jgi:hypothetical protein